MHYCLFYFLINFVNLFLYLFKSDLSSILSGLIRVNIKKILFLLTSPGYSIPRSDFCVLSPYCSDIGIVLMKII